MSWTAALRACSLALDIDEVLADSGPCLLVGHSQDGQTWLVARTAQGPGAYRWLCAAHSERALSCVRTGRAAAADAFCHSGTGTVHVITESVDGRISESVRLCAELNVSELPQPTRRVA
jgi:hypothetical protein